MGCYNHSPEFLTTERARGWHTYRGNEQGTAASLVSVLRLFAPNLLNLIDLN